MNKNLKKSFATFGALGSLGLLGANVAFAEEPVTETNPFTSTIPATGYIGAADDGNFQPDTLIQVETPTTVAWISTEDTDGAIEAVDYSIKNLSPQANLEVTFDGYIQTTSYDLTGLELFFTGDLAEGVAATDILTAADVTFDSILMSDAANGGVGGDEWEFSFDGQFTGNLPRTAMQPEFDFELSFVIDSYTVPGTGGETVEP